MHKLIDEYIISLLSAVLLTEDTWVQAYGFVTTMNIHWGTIKKKQTQRLYILGFFWFFFWIEHTMLKVIIITDEQDYNIILYCIIYNWAIEISKLFLPFLTTVCKEMNSK